MRRRFTTESCCATSICWPWPVAPRWMIAARMPMAVWSPPPVSPGPPMALGGWGPGPDMGEAPDGLGGRAIGRARHTHRAGHRLGDPLEALVVLIGPARAEALPGGGDEAGVNPF